MKIKILSCLFFIVFNCRSVMADTINVLSMDYPPFTAEADAENGPLFSLLREYASEHMPSKRIKAVFVPPARASRLLSMGHYCLSFYPPQAKPEEFEFIELSDEKVRLGLVRKSQPDSFSWQDLTELSGKSVAILRPDQAGKLLKMLQSAGLEAFYVESIVQGLKMLDRNRVDYAFGDNTTLLRLSEAAGIEKDLFQFSETSLLETMVGINVRKSCKESLFTAG